VIAVAEVVIDTPHRHHLPTFFVANHVPIWHRLDRMRMAVTVTATNSIGGFLFFVF
jgi:hypothetical protein